MNNNTIQKFKPKYNLAIGYTAIGLCFLLAVFFGKTSYNSLIEEGTMAMVIFFLICCVTIIIPLVAALNKTSTFELEGTVLTISYFFGLTHEVFDLQNITKVTAKERLITYGKDIRLMMGIKKTKEIKIEFENQKTIAIDGNTLQDSDFILLKNNLLKLVKIRNK